MPLPPLSPTDPQALPTRVIRSRLDFLLVEWHLNIAPIGSRLAALGLRLAFQSLLEQGCETPPVCFHDEYGANNVAVPVPGLQNVAVEHTNWAKKQSLAELNGKPQGERPRAATLRQLRADQISIASEQHVDIDCGRARTQRCFGACQYEHFACNSSLVNASYQLAVGTPTSPVYEDGSRIVDRAV